MKQLSGLKTPHTLVLDAGQFQDILVNEQPGNISVALFPAPVGTGLVSVTLSSARKVAEGEANWTAWPQGSVSTPTVDAVISPITALRVSCNAGQIRCEVKA